MKKPQRILVDPRWIEDAIAVNPKGGCDFHMEQSKPWFCPGCGCCQLARAYLVWKQRNKTASGGRRKA